MRYSSKLLVINFCVPAALCTAVCGDTSGCCMRRVVSEASSKCIIGCFYEADRVNEIPHMQAPALDAK